MKIEHRIRTLQCPTCHRQEAFFVTMVVSDQPFQWPVHVSDVCLCCGTTLRAGDYQYKVVTWNDRHAAYAAYEALTRAQELGLVAGEDEHHA